MVKKSVLFVLFLIIISGVSASLDQSTNITNDTAKQNSNFVKEFMEKEVSSNYFRYIGMPEENHKFEVIIYVLILLSIILIINDILDITDLFNKKIINVAVSLLITLIGIQNQILYNLVKPIFVITEVVNKTYYLKTGIVILVIIGLVVFLKALKPILKKLKESSREAEAERRADKLKVLSIAQDIEAKYRGID